MKLTENLTILPDNLEKNSTAEIYFSYRNHPDTQIFIEYSNKPLDITNTNIEKLEMSNIESNFFISIKLKKAGSFYFRFVDNENNIITFNNKQKFELFVDGSIDEENITESYSEQPTNYIKPQIQEKQEIQAIQNVQEIQKSENETLSEVTLDKQDNENINMFNTNDSLSLVPIKQNSLIHARKGIRLSYRINKRIRLILYKLFRKLPSFITGNYRRRINL